MPDLSVQVLLDNLRHTSLMEWAAVGFGLVYIVLIIRRNRWGWLAGGISSAISVALFARASLPMQALLQASYVASAFYGWWSWAPESKQQQISVWHLRGHLITLAVCGMVSFGLARLLADESVFPFTDSLVACIGLFATWLVARVRLENWVYWIVADAVSVYLCVAQGLLLYACLFAVYIVMASIGLRSWWKIRAAQSATVRAP